MSDTIKPVAWLCPVDDGDGPDISCNWEYASLFKGKADPLYTADALRQARNEALRDAAFVSRSAIYTGMTTTTEDAYNAGVEECVQRIGALLKQEKRDDRQ